MIREHLRSQLQGHEFSNSQITGTCKHEFTKFKSKNYNHKETKNPHAQPHEKGMETLYCKYNLNYAWNPNLVGFSNTYTKRLK